MSWREPNRSLDNRQPFFTNNNKRAQQVYLKHIKNKGESSKKTLSSSRILDPQQKLRHSKIEIASSLRGSRQMLGKDESILKMEENVRLDGPTPEEP